MKTPDYSLISPGADDGFIRRESVLVRTDNGDLFTAPSFIVGETWMSHDEQTRRDLGSIGHIFGSRQLGDGRREIGRYHLYPDNKVTLGGGVIAREERSPDGYTRIEFDDPPKVEPRLMGELIRVDSQTVLKCYDLDKAKPLGRLR